jgi:hypothetical protein
MTPYRARWEAPPAQVKVMGIPADDENMAVELAFEDMKIRLASFSESNVAHKQVEYCGKLFGTMFNSTMPLEDRPRLTHVTLVLCGSVLSLSLSPLCIFLSISKLSFDQVAIRVSAFFLRFSEDSVPGPTFVKKDSVVPKSPRNTLGRGQHHVVRASFGPACGVQ